MGGAIHHIGNIHKYARREDMPEKTMFIITTDGYENASRRYDYERVRRMIERQKEKYGWEFLFLGANIDAAKEAARFGIDADRAVNYKCDEEGTALNYEVIGEAVQAPQRRLETPHRRGRAEKREVSVCTERFWATSWAAPTNSTATTIRRRIFPCSAAVPTSPTTR